MCKEKYPKNPLFQKVEAQFVASACVRVDNEESRAMLAIWGGMTNRLKDKEMSFCQKIETMHQQGMAEMDKMGWTRFDKIPQTSMVTIKNRWSKAFGVVPAIIGQMWQIAKHSGTFWEKLLAVIKGPSSTNLGWQERAVSVTERDPRLGYPRGVDSDHLLLRGSGRDVAPAVPSEDGRIHTGQCP